jgi:hypothetical protein
MLTHTVFDKFTRISAALLSLACLAGCGGGGGAQPAVLIGPDPTALSASATTPNSLTAMLIQDKAATATGAPLRYTLTLSNPTTQAVSLEAFGGLNSQGQYDLSKVGPDAYFKITDAAGKTVYPNPNVNLSTAIEAPISITLPSGQTISEKVSLADGLSPSGRYQASAIFVVSGSVSASEVDTSVGPLTVSLH